MDDGFEWIGPAHFQPGISTVGKMRFRYKNGEVRTITTVNDGFLVVIKEADIVYENGTEAEISDVTTYKVVPRGLLVIQVNTEFGEQGFVWPCGPIQAGEMIDAYGDELSEIAFNQKVERLLLEELYVTPEKRIMAPRAEVAGALKKQKHDISMKGALMDSLFSIG